MVSRIGEYEDAIQRSGEDERTVAEFLLWIFRDIDARVAAGEDRATTVAELEAALRAYGTQQIDTVVNPIRAALKEAADLGTILTAGSVSPVILGAGVRTFVINEIERTKFAPAAMLVIVANDDATKVMWGRRLTYSKTTGELAVDILSSRGAGEVSSWTISAGALVGMAAQVPVVPVGGHDGQTVQEVLEELAEAIATEAAAFDEHAADRNNPHQVTAEQIGTMTTEDIAESFSILSTAINQQLAGRVRVDGDQAFSQGEQGQARANIGADLLGGFRNKVINGDFEIWQRGLSFTASGYTADRWGMTWGSGAAGSVSKQGGAVAYGSQMTYARISRTTLGSATSRFSQKIESVGTLAGKTVTVSFWARSSLPTEIRTIPVQNFGTGGSPSADVVVATGIHSLTSVWQRFNHVVTLPDIAGKTKGANGDDYLWLRFDWLTTAPNPLTNMDIAHVSVVEGDASEEADPFSPRHIQQELALCQRYYHRVDTWYGGFGVRYASAAVSNWDAGIAPFPVVMRAVPTAAILTAPIYQSCSDAAWSTRPDMAVMRVTVTAIGGYRAYGGVHSFDAEL